MPVRTSRSDPLRIDSVTAPNGGRIGMTICPGKKQRHAQSGHWDRDLQTDLEALVAWGATTLVTLMEDHELHRYQVAELGQQAERLGMTWHHLPMPDGGVPDHLFEAAWQTAGARLRAELAEGRAIAVHCRGGLGRTGLIAARLLIELGEAPHRALRRVRQSRPGAVETRQQEDYVLGLAWPPPP
jgi:ADP-ribosyl-[dinitrogen reductase] hydrolase